MPPEDLTVPALAEHFAPWLRLQPEDTVRRIFQAVVRDLARRNYTENDLRDLLRVYLFVAGAR